ncbi:MAG TPA: hypothetical protein VJ140_07835 [Actinomycetota bacterium]|nr:hypothetical protein [Actinomycetota bacterium]
MIPAPSTEATAELIGWVVLAVLLAANVVQLVRSGRLLARQTAALASSRAALTDLEESNRRAVELATELVHATCPICGHRLREPLP